MRQLRIATRIVIETMLSIRESGWSSWLTIGIFAVALTIFGGIFQFTMTLRDVVASWGSQLQISAYLKDGESPRQIARMVSGFSEVRQVEIVPKEVAWQEMQSSFKVAALENPLPNTLHIKLVSSDAVERAAAELKAIKGIEHIRYPLQVAKNINRFRHFIEAAGIAVTGALSMATLMVIGNTIQLVIQSRHQEIEILSLMGVSPWYIKAPLVFLGGIYGAVSAVVAILAIWGIHLYLDNYVTGQLASYIPALPAEYGYGMLPTFLILLALGVSVGAGGSAWTAGRFIKA